MRISFKLLKDKAFPVFYALLEIQQYNFKESIQAKLFFITESKLLNVPLIAVRKHRLMHGSQKIQLFPSIFIIQIG